MDERESVTSAAALLSIREPSLPSTGNRRYCSKRDIIIGGIQVIWAVLFVIIFKEVYHDRQINHGKNLEKAVVGEAKAVNYEVAASVDEVCRAQVHDALARVARLDSNSLDRTKRLSALEHRQASIEGVLKANQLETDKLLLSMSASQNIPC